MAENEDQIKDEEVVEDQSQDEAQEETQEEVQNEEQEQEEEQLEDEQEEEQVEEETQQQEPAPSRREQLRIQDLLKKYGPPQERTNPQNQGINYEDMIEAEPEVYQQLSQASQQFGNQQYQEGLKQANAITFNTRLEVDAPKVASKYPQLDKDSDDFNPAVASSLNEMYLSSVGYNPQDGSVTNPNLRYSDYIEAMFELVDEAASRKVQTSTRNVTRQVAKTGLRPDGSSAERVDLNKNPEAMSDKELDLAMAKMGLAPKKRN